MQHVLAGEGGPAYDTGAWRFDPDDLVLEAELRAGIDDFGGDDFVCSRTGSASRRTRHRTPACAMNSSWDRSLSPAARRRARRSCTSCWPPAGRHGGHQHSFADLGLDEAEVRDRFADYMATFL